jgi:hypothetical protein
MELGEAIGWRAWRVVEGEDELRLASVLYEDVWPVDEPLVARCAHGHRAPDFECACGVHAARRRELALPYRIGRDDARTVGRVVGRVALWGDVVEHRDGWRGSHAYPLELWAPRDFAALHAYGAIIRADAAHRRLHPGLERGVEPARGARRAAGRAA